MILFQADKVREAGAWPGWRDCVILNSENRRRLRSSARRAQTVVPQYIRSQFFNIYGN